MPLPHCQPRGMDIGGLISPFLQFAWTWGVWALEMQLPPWPLEFSSKGFADKWYYSIPLQLLFIAFPQLSICVLYGQAGRQGAILSP